MSSIHLLPQGVSGLFLLCTKVIHLFIASGSFWPVFALYKSHPFIFASGSFWPVFALYKSHPFIYCLREFLVCFCFVQKSSIHLLPQRVSGLFLLCTKVIHSFIASGSFWPVFALYKSHPFIYCLREFLACFCFVQKSPKTHHFISLLWNFPLFIHSHYFNFVFPFQI